MNLLSTADIAFLIAVVIFFVICLLAVIYFVQKESDEGNYEVMLFEWENREVNIELSKSQMGPSRRERDEGE